MRTKQEIRKQYLQARRELTPEERAEKSARAAVRIAALPEFRTAGTILLYQAMPDEPDLQSLAEGPASAGRRFAYPVCISRTEMAAMLPGSWRKGAFGIREPDPETSQIVPPEAIDLVICPGVAFDEKKTRLGMGGGYYDRYLPECVNAKTVLAAFEVQRAEERLPREPEDVPVDWVVTEDGVY